MPEDFELKLLKGVNIDKAAGIDNVSGKFWKMEQNQSPKHVIFP